MTETNKSDNEPFFWIKTGRKAENPIQDRAENRKVNERAISTPSERPKLRGSGGKIKETARAGLQPGWIRASFIVREEYLSRLKQNAYWDRKAIKDILDEILGTGLKNYRPSEPSDEAKRAKK
jgi:hypothetical protein